MAEKRWTFLDALVRRFKAKPDEEAETSRDVAEEINEALPEGLSARKAVLRKRKQLREIDRMLEDS